jgi:hypothetical protein
VRRAARKDSPQAAIVDALRAIGVMVFVLNQEGLPDLLCYFRGVWMPLEIKRPRGKLTAAQWLTRKRAPFPVAETIDQALVIFGDIQRYLEDCK